MQPEILKPLVEAFLATQAAQTPLIRDHYHVNYIVTLGGQRMVVRVLRDDHDDMDIHRMPEPIVLRLLEERHFPAQRLLLTGENNTYQVHSFVEGTLVHDAYPSGDLDTLPEWIVEQVAQIMARLHRIDYRPIASYCDDLNQTPDTASFFRYLLRYGRRIDARLRPFSERDFDWLGIPRDPFAALESLADQVQPRPFALVHGDLHRENMIIDPGSRRLLAIDWEFAQIADPVYDIAVHVERMSYRPDFERHFLESYLFASGRKHVTEDWLAQVRLYRAFEWAKSSLVSGDRFKHYARVAQPSPARLQRSLRNMQHRLINLSEIWGKHIPAHVMDDEQVLLWAAGKHPDVPAE